MNDVDLMVRNFTEDFFKSIEHLIGHVEFVPKKPIDAAKFPFELEEKLGDYRSGIYIFWSKISNEILYIGISNDIPGRFWQHKGTNFSWTKNGSQAFLPNIFKEQLWLPDQIKNILKNAEFYVTVITLKPFEVAHLLESFLIFKLKPIINVNGK
jgi:hypothetical protein